MTSQQQADLLLSEWRANSHLPPAQRLKPLPGERTQDNDYEALLADLGAVLEVA